MLADPGRRLADLHLGLGRRVLRLEDFLLRTEGFDARHELLLGTDQLLLLVLELRHLRVHVLQLLLRDRLALESLPGQVLPVGGDRLARLRLELDHVLLDGLGLQLEALLRRDHVRDAPLHVLELLEHLLVRVVQRLGRVLGAVERAGRLRLEDQGEALPETCHRNSFSRFPLA